MTYHVNISGRGLTLKSANRFNLSEEEVRTLFVEPWESGNEIISGGKVFDPRDSEISIMEGDPLTQKEMQNLAAWAVVIERSVDVTDHFIVVAPGSRSSIPADASSEFDPRRVAVIHGRDASATAALFDFLRAIGLHPLEWTELVKATGSGAPSNRTVVEALFALAAVVVVLMTPDDESRLHPTLVTMPDTRGEGAWACQPRPNVFLESGMALAFHPDRTIFVELGSVRQASDLHGVNTVRLDGTAPPLHDFVQRLETAGCEVDTSGSDWLRIERFTDLDARTRLPIVRTDDEDGSRGDD